MLGKISDCSGSLIDLFVLLISIILAVASPILGQDDVTAFCNFTNSPSHTGS